MKEIQTVGDFLERSGARYQVFDMGRRVIPIDTALFEAFECFETPYPYPLQQQAWIGLLGWHEDGAAEQFIWFLRLPLDELGCLVPAARHDFIYRLLEHLGASREARVQGGELQDMLAESPYGFRPPQNRMAVFHAKALCHLDLPPSRFYAAAREYLSGTLGYEQWRFLGVQGLADVCARRDHDGNHGLLAVALPELPGTPWGVLCECLENEALDPGLVKVIATRLRGELRQAEPDRGIITAGLRAISYAPDGAARQALEAELLAAPIATDIELLAAIAGRCWEDLLNPPLAVSYFEALARSDTGDAGFGAIMADLLYLPGMREPLMHILRGGGHSARLAKRLEGFLGGVSG